MSTPYGQQPDYGTGYGYGGAQASGWEVSAEKNTAAPWALGIGVVGILMAVSMILTMGAFIPGIIGLVVGLIALAKGRRIHGPGRRTGMTVTGLVLSVLSIAASLAFFVFIGVIARETGVMDCINLPTTQEQQECINDAIDGWINSFN